MRERGFEEVMFNLEREEMKKFFRVPTISGML